jgi:hypothetical protein
MNVQFLSKEKGLRAAILIPRKEWKKIQDQLKHRESDFWETLPDHVKQSIERGQKQAASGETKTNEQVMQKYAKYL